MLSAGGSADIHAGEGEENSVYESPWVNENGEGKGEVHPDSEREDSARVSRSRVVPDRQ